MDFVLGSKTGIINIYFVLGSKTGIINIYFVLGSKTGIINIYFVPIPWFITSLLWMVFFILYVYIVLLME